MASQRDTALATMDLTRIMRGYIQQAVDELGSGYKGLLLDAETMRVCSTMFGRTELSDHAVVCVERIDKNGGMAHKELKARVCRARAAAAGDGRESRGELGPPPPAAACSLPPAPLRSPFTRPVLAPPLRAHRCRLLIFASPRPAARA
jgi:hypothetical protein